MGSQEAIARRLEGGPRRHRLTVHDFLMLDEAGAFTGIGHVELIDGEIFTVAPLHAPHAWIQMELTVEIGLAVRQLPDYRAYTPVSAELDVNSLPEADIVVARKGGDGRFVTAAFVQLLVEVADSSLRHDLGRKLRLYARAGVPEYWVADVKGRRIIRFHAPAGDAYDERTEFAFGDTVPSATIAGLTVDTARLV